MKNNVRIIVVPLILVGLSSGVGGCATNQGTGALIGTGAGAGAGALIGSNVAGSGKRTQGALIGAGAGALIGGVTGSAIGKNGDDEKKAREKQDLKYQEAAPAPQYAPPAAPAPATPYTPPPQYSPQR